MEKLKLIPQIKKLYAEGGNIIQYLKNNKENTKNSIEDILISYDFQSGSYVKDFLKNPDYKISHGKKIAGIINKLCSCETIMEVGVGEATTLCNVVANLDTLPENIKGFDISWSRLKYGKELLKDKDIKASLFVANLFNIPLPDNSVDVIYTSHSIEPNGGYEKEALTELFRVTKKYLVLLEPGYEFANDEAKKRMENHGYITKLYDTALELGYEIQEHRLFDGVKTPLNPTSLMVIRKTQDCNEKNNEFVCPVSGEKLDIKNDNILFSTESCLGYPVIEGIPLLLDSNGVLMTHYTVDYNDFKKENGF